MGSAAGQRNWNAPDATQGAALAVGLVLVLLLAGCLQSQPPRDDGPDTTTEYVYSWSTTSAIGLDGGARIAMEPPATSCEIDTAIAGWTSDPGMEALWLFLPAEHDMLAWTYKHQSGFYVQNGAEDTNMEREVLDAGGVALSGGGSLTQGGVVYMLAKNLTSWAAPDGNVFPALFIEARCDAPGLSIMYARDAMMLHDRSMDDGTIVGGGAGGVDVSVARNARQERELNGAVELFAMSPTAMQNNMEGTLAVEAPDAQHSWTIGPEIFYEHGPAGHYRAKVDRTAASLAGCAEPGAPCGTSTDWWGFIAGFEETDDPDAYFGLRDA